MIFLILDDQSLTGEVLEAWERAGTPGATVLPSAGYRRIRSHAGLREDFPLMPSLARFFESEENTNHILLAIVPDHEMVTKLVEATQAITGDLNLPHTGIMAVLPLVEVYGLNRKSR